MGCCLLLLLLSACRPASSGAQEEEADAQEEPVIRETAGTADPARFSVLVYSRTEGFRHASIPDGLATLRALGQEAGFSVEATEDSAAFAKHLETADVVVFLNTTGDVLGPTGERAFKSFIQQGGGFVGVHAASDTEYDWSWYGGLVGAYFESHPEVQEAVVRVTDTTHASTRMLPAAWTRTDEWYNFRAAPREGVRVLATLDESTYSGGTMGEGHPAAWYHTYDGGRAWYTAGGHTAASYQEPLFREHLLGGIRWAAGKPAAPEAGAGDSGSREQAALDAPEGMVYVPGGTTTIGVKEGEQAVAMSRRHASSSIPAFEADVAPFFMDKHPVTVAQFRRFVEATGYETEAERFGDAGVMDPRTGQWRLVKGATWHHPFGPDGPAAPEDHPVTQVSWNDAEAYAAWAGKRLPTEVEWEHAARGAVNRRAFCPWGTDARVVEGVHQANTWQGRFPVHNAVEDGYAYTSPVGAFGETALGLSDMGGNVWEWTASWYRPYAERSTPFMPTAQSERVQRGGSFQCDECGGYRVYTRSHSTPETSLFHVGFRCVKGVGEETRPRR